MLSSITEKLRAFAHRKLQGGPGGSAQGHPLTQRVREVANTVNDLLGKPIRGAGDVVVPDASSGSAATVATVATVGVPPAATAPSPVQAPVLLYFDGKDHRTKVRVEELLRARNIVFQILDVANDEAERSWITTAARREEFPIVVIAGAPVGGLEELTQLDVQGELKRMVFGTA